MNLNLLNILKVKSLLRYITPTNAMFFFSSLNERYYYLTEILHVAKTNIEIWKLKIQFRSCMNSLTIAKKKCRIKKTKNSFIYPGNYFNLNATDAKRQNYNDNGNAEHPPSSSSNNWQSSVGMQCVTMVDGWKYL